MSADLSILHQSSLRVVQFTSDELPTVNEALDNWKVESFQRIYRDEV